MNYIFISITLCIIIFIILNHFIIPYISKSILIEDFCKIPEANPQGTLNDRSVDLTDYKAQSNIHMSSCDKYWKDWPLESNNTLIEDNPIVIYSDQLALPKEKQFGNSSYLKGLIDFAKFENLISDKVGFDPLAISTELDIDPITKEKYDQHYKLEYAYYERNKKTYVNRWQQYNPSVKMYFKYDDIQSDISAINILNLEFKTRIDTRQKAFLDKSQLILYGIVPFDIFKYKILKIQYVNSDVNKPIYIIEISLYRESDYYINTFSYVGWIRDSDGAPIITNVAFIGRNPTDSVLSPSFYNKDESTDAIINNKFYNTDLLEMNPDAILAQTKMRMDAYKLKNQYGCFNMNYDPTKGGDNILPYPSREECETSFDSYGRPKAVGIYDTPCKKNTDCPFYKANANYQNEFGKCADDGYCELPINMERVGYRYFKNNPEKKALCYNCNSKDLEVYGSMDTCCDEQYNTASGERYDFLKSPDYAFEGDFQERRNAFNTKPVYINKEKTGY
jgi:hypothetical protein